MNLITDNIVRDDQSFYFNAISPYTAHSVELEMHNATTLLRFLFNQ